MNGKTILAFLIGAGVGAFVAYKTLESKIAMEYEEALDAEINYVRDMYAAREISDIDNGLTEEEYAEKVSDITRKYCPGAEANEMRKNMIYRKTDANKVRYDGYSTSGAVIDETPTDVAPVDTSRPYVISLEDFADGCSEYEKVSLYYYDKDDILINEEEQVMPEVDTLIGSALLCFGNASDDPDIVYVRNDPQLCDYEIVRYYTSYQEEILGLPKEEIKKRRKLNEGD